MHHETSHVIQAELALADIENSPHSGDSGDSGDGPIDLEQLRFDLAAQLGISPACIHGLTEQPENADGDHTVTLTLIEPDDSEQDDAADGGAGGDAGGGAGGGATSNRTEDDLFALPGELQSVDGRLAEFSLVEVTIFRPQPPFCDGLRSNTSALHITIQETSGFEILAYELIVLGQLTADDGGASLSGRDQVLGYAKTGATLAERQVLVSGLQEETPYKVKSRVQTTLGWSDYSDLATGCVTLAHVPPPFDWLMLLLPLLLTALVVLMVLLWAWKKNVHRMIVPKLKSKKKRTKEQEEREARSSFMENYMTSDANPTEDTDPELALNPLYRHKLELQRAKEEEARRAKMARKGQVEMKSGGLKRLGLGIVAANEMASTSSKPQEQLDDFLASQGVAVGKSAAAAGKRAAGGGGGGGAASLHEGSGGTWLQKQPTLNERMQSSADSRQQSSCGVPVGHGGSVRSTPADKSDGTKSDGYTAVL